MKAYLNLRSLELLQIISSQRTEAETPGEGIGKDLSRDMMVLLARQIYEQVVDNDVMEEKIDTSDIPETDREFWKGAEVKK